jgi:hypothetical protein
LLLVIGNAVYQASLGQPGIEGVELRIVLLRPRQDRFLKRLAVVEGILRVDIEAHHVQAEAKNAGSLEIREAPHSGDLFVNESAHLELHHLGGRPFMSVEVE